MEKGQIINQKPFGPYRYSSGQQASIASNLVETVMQAYFLDYGQDAPTPEDYIVVENTTEHTTIYLTSAPAPVADEAGVTRQMVYATYHYYPHTLDERPDPTPSSPYSLEMDRSMNGKHITTFDANHYTPVPQPDGHFLMSEKQ